MNCSSCPKKKSAVNKQSLKSGTQSKLFPPKKPKQKKLPAPKRQKTVSNRKKKASAVPKKVLPRQWKPRIQGTGYTGGASSYETARSTVVACASSASGGGGGSHGASAGAGQPTTTTYYDKTGQPRVVNLGHFLAQTWWRKGGGQKRKSNA